MCDKDVYYPLYMKHTTTQHCDLQFVKYGHCGWCISLAVKGYDFKMKANGHQLGVSTNHKLIMAAVKEAHAPLQDSDTPYMKQFLPPQVLQQVVASSALNIELELLVPEGSKYPPSVQITQEWICPLNKDFQPLLPSALISNRNYNPDDFERFLETDKFKLPPQSTSTIVEKKK